MRKREKELKIVIRGESPRSTAPPDGRCRDWMNENGRSFCVGFRVVMDALDSCKEQASMVK